MKILQMLKHLLKRTPPKVPTSPNPSFESRIEFPLDALKTWIGDSWYNILKGPAGEDRHIQYQIEQNQLVRYIAINHPIVLSQDQIVEMQKREVVLTGIVRQVAKSEKK